MPNANDWVLVNPNEFLHEVLVLSPGTNQEPWLLSEHDQDGALFEDKFQMFNAHMDNMKEDLAHGFIFGNHKGMLCDVLPMK